MLLTLIAPPSRVKRHRILGIALAGGCGFVAVHMLELRAALVLAGRAQVHALLWKQEGPRDLSLSNVNSSSVYQLGWGVSFSCPKEILGIHL